MKRVVALLLFLGALALPVGFIAADCLECVADRCESIEWVGSANGHYGRYHCSQTVRCFPNGHCYDNCLAFGDVCSYWDVWF